MLQARRIWWFAVHPHLLNPLSMVNSMLTQFQLRTWTPFPTLNTLKTSQTCSLNHCHLLCDGRKHTLAHVLHLAITLLNHGNAMLTVSLGRTYNTHPTTRLRRMRGTNRSSMRSRRRASGHTMPMCWRKNIPHCVSQPPKTRMASRSSWLACQMIRLSRSGNYTLSKIWNGMIITNALSNTGVETSSKPGDGWCGSQSISSII